MIFKVIGGNFLFQVRLYIYIQTSGASVKLPLPHGNFAGRAPEIPLAYPQNIRDLRDEKALLKHLNQRPLLTG